MNFFQIDDIVEKMKKRILGQTGFEIAEVAHHGPEDIFITIFTLSGAFYMMMQILNPINPTKLKKQKQK